MLALAFPKFNLPWLAPLGAAGLFWLCQRLSWKRIFLVAWFGATVFFCITFSWFGYTVGSMLGNLAFALVFVPALGEGAYVAASAVLVAFAFKRVTPPFAPLAAAAAFTIFEWLRSIGPVGVPFGQLGYSQADTPLAVFAAFIGTFGVTFIICAIAGYLSQAIILRRNQFLLGALAVTIVAWFICWWAWPARHIAPPTLRVAAIQGNIQQSTKWHGPGALQHAVARYSALTARTSAYGAKLTVWPETVITTILTADPNLQRQIGALARQQATTLAIGSLNEHGAEQYNSLFVFAPNGRLTYIYDKRQLVPFAEGFPGRSFLSWIPYTNLITGFGNGTEDSIFHAGGMALAPLICWESAFADLTHAQMKAGAQAFVIVTDDAWFGETAGPYQHAQIARLRAIETGTWILRAASTGVSGIIAPNGAYVQQTDLDREAVLLGAIGQPSGSVFARLGPTSVMFSLVVVYAALLTVGRRAAI